MNKYEANVMCALASTGSDNQRMLSAKTGLSLGLVNKSIKGLRDEGLITDKLGLTSKGRKLLNSMKPRNAVILAAGFGMRMVPINMEIPKGLLKVKGELLIERQIEQLHEAGIKDITIVVGFLKEQYEYLMDKYGVDLVVNADYSTKNNLYSVKKALKLISDTYIIPCDIWCRNNPFNNYEPYSWYMVTDKTLPGGGIKLNRQSELTGKGGHDGNRMIGISFISSADSYNLKNNINELTEDPANDSLFWEAALYNNDLKISARIVNDNDAVEINTFEQLREFDAESDNTRNDALDVVAKCFNASSDEIVDISILKKGMTNRSFIFSLRGKRYIMRIPGEGTDLLIDRKHEASVYETISGLGFCDDPVYINADNGYKITRFLENVRTLDPENEDDLVKGMKLLRKFHDSNLQVGHEFDLFGQVEYYVTLCKGAKSVYKDHDETQANVLSLRKYVEDHVERRCLTHIDAIPDNFLFYHEDDGEEKLQLTDWEYSGMQDPHVDLAMFTIYSYYNRAQADHLIDLYFDGNCPIETRIKVYCYIAICGLLWSNWCDFKSTLGVEFGEYSLKQYRYAKDFYRIAKEEASKIGITI